jgi:hypothetical protein
MMRRSIVPPTTGARFRPMRRLCGAFSASLCFGGRDVLHNGENCRGVDGPRVTFVVAQDHVEGEAAMRKHVLPIVVAFGCSLALVWAKPLTRADIEGKKICWGTTTNLFKPGGKVYNNVAGEGTWSVNKAGDITFKFPKGPYSGTATDLGGGSFEYTGSWVGTPNMTIDGGAFCN